MIEQNVTVRLNPNGTVAVTDDGIESLYPFPGAQYAADPEIFEVYWGEYYKQADAPRSALWNLRLLMGLPEDRS